MQPFSRVKVDYLVKGGARVTWEMQRHFTDAGPYTFQLQVGRTGLVNDLADDWEDVSTPVIDTYVVIDDEKREFGKLLDVHYRVKLTTTLDVYYSMPADVSGLLPKRDWIIMQETLRKEQLRHRVFTSPNGLLIKARRYGPVCTSCTDALTGEVAKIMCTDCYGTGFLNGYFTPLEDTYADISGDSNREHRNPNSGTEKLDTIKGRFVGTPQIYSYDVWVNATSDERYYLHNIMTASQIRGVVLVYEAEMRLAPFSDIIYQLPINEMLTNPGVLWQKKLNSTELKTGKEVSKCKKVQETKKNYLDMEMKSLKKTKRK